MRMLACSLRDLWATCSLQPWRINDGTSSRKSAMFFRRGNRDTKIFHPKVMKNPWTQNYHVFARDDWNIFRNSHHSHTLWGKRHGETNLLMVTTTKLTHGILWYLHIWRCPKIGLAPVIIHFMFRCSHEINDPAWAFDPLRWHQRTDGFQAWSDLVS